MRHIAMIIEMVAAQISKHGGGKFQRRHAMLHQAVRRDFHRAEGRALRNQTGQHMLNIHSGTGCVLRRDHFTQQSVTYRPHHCAGFAEQLAPLRQ
ncbi:Uncharacterised protein [Salmonella enterica subsp. enterica serovar Bovismorbificans]|nr:Uncharacterised protein [Salmonella enterica subsp. enterica serovar Bovismorbificans]CNU16672.1 Uncharacterised protein [Salmonella enterica subsp. enterica serovar Bovismorbificans]CNU79499.1 Uncharacterised protein [Salmonella enterica subsp. enterica serovar Bovismorbificans]